MRLRRDDDDGKNGLSFKDWNRDLGHISARKNYEFANFFDWLIWSRALKSQASTVLYQFLVPARAGGCSRGDYAREEVEN